VRYLPALLVPLLLLVPYLNLPTGGRRRRSVSTDTKHGDTVTRLHGTSTQGTATTADCNSHWVHGRALAGERARIMRVFANSYFAPTSSGKEMGDHGESGRKPQEPAVFGD
jgi:hypothetical protein